MFAIDELVARAKADGASDIHLICGLPPKYRLDGELRDMSGDVMTVDDCIALAQYLSGDGFERFARDGELDAAGTFAGVRCRIHVFRQQGVPSVALRLLRQEIPDLKSLGLPPATMDLPKLHKGIVLVTGETGTGKSTTLAGILNEINHTRRCHIVTLEDPIEYIYTPDLCAINQREVGKDTRSFADGLRASVREDPDVILISEMRDRDTIETAIATSSAIGGQTMDQALVRLVRMGAISRDTATHYAHDIDFIKKNAL